MFPGSSPGSQQRTTKTIRSGQSVAGFTLLGYSVANSFYKRVNCGALVANELSTIFSKTDGPCEMTHLAVVTADGAARTMRVYVEIDEGIAFDYTSASNAAIDKCVILAGPNIYNQIAQMPSIRSEKSLVVKVASNSNETDKFYIDYAYQELK